MAQHRPLPVPPGEPDWDIAFTRLTQTVQPRVAACALDLGRRFQALGLGSETDVRQTPRGLSTFLALLGRRGLVCIVDMTLVDGMALCQGPCAALDIRLLDACGDVAAQGLAGGASGRTFHEMSAFASRISDHLDRAATVVYVATLGHFDVLRPIVRQA